jgi:hypothetical protein
MHNTCPDHCIQWGSAGLHQVADPEHLLNWNLNNFDENAWLKFIIYTEIKITKLKVNLIFETSDFHGSEDSCHGSLTLIKVTGDAQ